MKQQPHQLDYGTKPHRRRRGFWMGCGLFFAVVFIGIQWKTTLFEDLRNGWAARSVYRQCASSPFPAGQLVFAQEEDGTLLDHSEHSAYVHEVRFPFAKTRFVQPRAVASMSFWSQMPQHGGASVFAGSRSPANGDARMLAIFVSGQGLLQAPTPQYFHDNETAVWANWIVFDRFDWRGNPESPPVIGRVQLGNWPNTQEKRTRFYFGAADPDDASRFSIRYEIGNDEDGFEEGFIDGRLEDDLTVRLAVRDGPLLETAAAAYSAGMPKKHTLDELQGHYEIEGVVRFDGGEGGLTRAVVTAPEGEAHVYLHGAHVTHFQPRGQAPVLFTSGQSRFELGRPIRGGVPVIFPWFGPRQGHPDAQLHGFARLMEWGVESVEQNEDGSVTIVFDLASHDATREQWPHEFELRYRVTVGRTLDMVLEVRNTSDAPFRFEEALHTYLAVGDVRQVKLEGLENTAYLDKVKGMQRFEQGNEPLRFTAETDRIYLDTQAACVVDDPVNGRRIRIDKENSATTVVWNPWEEKARNTADLGDDEWPSMLCVETCNVAAHAVELPPGQVHRMRAVIGVE